MNEVGSPGSRVPPKGEHTLGDAVWALLLLGSLSWRGHLPPHGFPQAPSVLVVVLSLRGFSAL